jgi:hypothetical protein
MPVFGGKADIGPWPNLYQQKFAVSERVPSGTVGELKPAEIGSKSQTDP